MKYLKKLSLAGLLCLMAVLAFTGCKKDKDAAFHFQSSAERPDGEKTYLVNENWIYWREGDRISVGSDANGTNPPSIGELVLRGGGGDEYNGVYETTLPDNSEIFLGLYPHSDQNVISYGGGTFNDVKLNFPAVQDFADDFTFGSDAFPMVAYCTGDYPYKMQFHSLAGLVRIELYAATAGAESDIKEIVFTESSNKQISGLFAVNNWIQFAPYLTSLANNDANRKITINCSGRHMSTGPEGLLTFYLCLPALNPASGTNGATTYNLQMKVVREGGSQQFLKSITVPVRRNGITKLPALGISSWGDAGSSGSGTCNVSITGNGTKERPFQIYSMQDMMIIRDCINNGVPINGQPVTPDTYFRVMRSDIVLNNEWTAGIEKFVGHFVYAANNTAEPGITNNSRAPIFESIASSGTVEGLVVKGTSNFEVSTGRYFSPLCNTNDGKLVDCVVAMGSSFSMGSTAAGVESAGVAGICVTNNSLIQGCGVRGTVQSRNHTAAGICYTNNAIIEGCYAVSPMQIANNTRNAAGICYDNRSAGKITDCYFTAYINSSSTNWGCIAYKNAGQMSRCYVEHPGIVTALSYGGIVNRMTAGVIDYCWSNCVYTSGGTSESVGGLGGIVNYLTGGDIRNCYVNMPAGTYYLAQGNGGGFVGDMAGGTIKNCFVHCDVQKQIGNCGMFVGRITSGEIANCLGYESVGNQMTFCGLQSGGTVTSCYCRKVGGSGITVFDESTGLATVSTNLDNWVRSSQYMTWVHSSTAGVSPSLSGRYYGSKKH